MYGDKFRRFGGGSESRDRIRDAEIEKNLERNWDRHPELRAQYGNSFERYLLAQRDVIFT